MSFFSKLLFYTGYLFSYMCPFKITYLYWMLWQYLYTGWISRFFYSFGQKTTIQSFSSLIGPQYISIGNFSLIGKRAVVTAWDKYKGDCFTPRIIIGNNVNIGDDCHITAINRIEIGNNVLMGKKITITDNSHGKITKESVLLPPAIRSLYSPGEVIIEEGVWIGDKVTILPNVRIGKNSIIGANSVVTSNVEGNCVYAGVPARKLKEIDKI
ncbi:acyltransferase [Dysgonomonas capnocytophagoides]|uniref:acyltransferase n=1 Tax=Dysgonomonas capnocytophagoides TaxID=45254 RepID=UPI00333F0C63